MGFEVCKGEAPVVGVEEGRGDARRLRIRCLAHLCDHNHTLTMIMLKKEEEFHADQEWN